MYTITRVSTVPGTALQVQIDQPMGDGDGGFQAGGIYQFMPAGQDGDTHQVSEYAATVLMTDRGLAKHFTCTPDLPTKAVKAVAADVAAANEAATANDPATVAAGAADLGSTSGAAKRGGRGGRGK